MLNFWEVKELRSYRSRWSLGVKPLVLSIGYKRNNIWLNSLTPLTSITCKVEKISSQQASRNCNY